MTRSHGGIRTRSPARAPQRGCARDSIVSANGLSGNIPSFHVRQFSYCSVSSSGRTKSRSCTSANHAGTGSGIFHATALIARVIDIATSPQDEVRMPVERLRQVPRRVQVIPRRRVVPARAPEGARDQGAHQRQVHRDVLQKTAVLLREVALPHDRLAQQQLADRGDVRDRRRLGDGELAARDLLAHIKRDGVVFRDSGQRASSAFARLHSPAAADNDRGPQPAFPVRPATAARPRRRPRPPPRTTTRHKPPRPPRRRAREE